MVDIDQTSVKCPNGCLLSAGFGRTVVVPKQFKWCEEANEDVGTRNYCERCGAELVEAEND